MSTVVKKTEEITKTKNLKLKTSVEEKKYKKLLYY